MQTTINTPMIDSRTDQQPGLLSSSMTLPKIRLTITLRESQLLDPGLRQLTNGLASARVGSYPHRHPYDRIDSRFAQIHLDRAFDEAMARRLNVVKMELAGMAGSRKLRLDCFDVAAAAFALRVHRKLLVASLRTPDEKKLLKSEISLLGARLELYRRRAKLAAKSRLDKTDFADLTRTWSSFLAWCRFNLLQFRVSSPTKRTRMMLWRQQREAIRGMIREALLERHYGVLGDAELARMTLLAKEALRRRRLPMTLMQVIESGPSGRQLLFAFVKKRSTFIPLFGAKLSLAEEQSARGERIEAARRRRLLSPTELL